MNNSITAMSVPVIGCVVLLTADDNVVESIITVNKGMVILDFKKSYVSRNVSSFKWNFEFIYHRALYLWILLV